MTPVLIDSNGLFDIMREDVRWAELAVAAPARPIPDPVSTKPAAMSKRRDLNPKAIRKVLEQERDELLEMSAGVADERRPVELDQQSVGRLSRMDAMQVQAMAQAVEARRRGRLQRIEAALRRLDDGDYGTCVDCGEDIPAKRLAIDPTIARCVDCAE